METTQTNATATESQDLFQENEFVSYTEASTTQRFLNFIIDAILMQYGIAWATGYLLVKLIIAISPETAYSLFVEGSPIVAAYLIGLFNYLLYYTICEKAFRGYTVGKLVTGTRAIRLDGQELTFKNALLRSLCRMVPFEPFSIWGGNGLWHDAWTKTIVIKAR